MDIYLFTGGPPYLEGFMATKEYLKNGVLYRDDLKVGEDGMNCFERAAKQRYSPDAPVGVDGLTAVQRQIVVRKAEKEKRTYSLELLKKEFKLGKSANGGTVWTHQAVAAYMAREMDFIVTGVYKNNRTPLEGFCLRCGESPPECNGPRWDSITQGNNACSSNACGGNRMPTEKFMEAAFTERGFELVGAYPTRNSHKFWLRHIGGEGACQQKYEATWREFYTSKNGCAVCSGKQIAVGYNDLATVNPALAAEMVFPDPTTVTAGSDIKADWKCGVCGHEWSVRVAVRGSLGSGCPRCSKTGFDTSKPGWLYLLMRHRNGRLEFQWGITNHLEQRTRQYIKYDWVVIDYKYYLSGQQCKDQESELNSMLRKLDAFGVIPPDHKIYMCCTEAFPSGYEIPNPTSVNDLINFNAYWKSTSTERVE